MEIGSLLLSQRFAVPIVPYTESDLHEDLAQGVGNVLAGVGSDFRLDVAADTGSILFRHKDAAYGATAGAGYTGAVRTALGITASGIIAGYNRQSDGAWVNSLVIDGTTGSATFTGAINATSGNFTGTVTAGSIISGDATVNGVPLSSFASGGYTKDDLEADLASGVGGILAGVGSDYRMTVDTATPMIVLGHSLANYGKTGGGAAYSTTLRTALAITSTGIAMGYNRKSDGNWVNAVAIDASGNASFSGAITATSGTFTGTIQAGSVIDTSATVGGTAMSTIKANAAAGATAVQPAAIANMLTSSSSYILGGTVTVTEAGKGIRTGNIAWDAYGTVNAGSGVAITSKGLVGAVNGVTTFSINGTTGAAVFKGNITGASGTFSGDLVTSGQVIGQGSSSITIGGTALAGAVIGVSEGSGHEAVRGYLTGTASASAINGESKSTSTASSGVNGVGPKGVSGTTNITNGTGVAGVGNGTGADILAAGTTRIGLGGTTVQMRNLSNMLRMTDSGTPTEAWPVLYTGNGAGSGGTATLGPKMGANTAMSGWMTVYVGGVKAYVPYWLP